MRRLRRAAQRNSHKRGTFRHRILTAGTAAAITLAAGSSLQKACAAEDPHELLVKQNADNDLLADREEFAIGYNVFNPDQNHNTLPDGRELAKRCGAAIAGLPEFEYSAPPGTDYPHKIRYLTDGTETCDICGLRMCMDHWDIVNPALAVSVPLPVMAAHFMEHGSFSFAASYHNGRADLPLLLRALEVRFPQDPNDHELPLDYVFKGIGPLAPDANDLDADLLADSEELAAGLDLRDADQDDNLVPDGIQLAEQCAAVIDNLPVYDPASGDPEPADVYKVNHWLRGLEACAICGARVNMGYWQVVNPKLALSYDAYDIMLHYMTHGSFSHHGLHIDSDDPFHTGRIDIPLLLKILEMPRQCGHLGTVYLPADFNRDCREDFADFASFGDNWLGTTDPNLLPEPKISCRIGSCDQILMPGDIDGDFSLEVDGSYLRFHDDILANCCPADITVEMAVQANTITIFEKEYVTFAPCPCLCEFPASAIAGPFQAGIYDVEVYLLRGIEGGVPATTGLLGGKTIRIGSNP